MGPTEGASTHHNGWSGSRRSGAGSTRGPVPSNCERGNIASGLVLKEKPVTIQPLDDRYVSNDTYSGPRSKKSIT